MVGAGRRQPRVRKSTSAGLESFIRRNLKIFEMFALTRADSIGGAMTAMLQHRSCRNENATSSGHFLSALSILIAPGRATEHEALQLPRSPLPRSGDAARHQSQATALNPSAEAPPAAPASSQ